MLVAVESTPDLLQNGRFYTKRRVIRQCATKDSWSRRVKLLVPVFEIEKHNQTNKKWLPKFVHAENASSGIKTANGLFYPTDL